MTEFLLTKGISTTYGASKTSASVNTATTPDLLADGAVGIYYIANGMPKLLATTDTTLSTAVSDSGLPVSKIPFFYAVGTATGVVTTKPITSENTISSISTEYAAPTYASNFVGYDRVNASKNFGLTAGNLTGLLTYDEAGVSLAIRSKRSIQDDFKTYSASLTAGDTEWNIASKVADAINVDLGTSKQKVYAEVVTPAIVGAVGAITTATVTKGSTQVVVGAIGNLVVNDFIQFGMIAGNLVGAVPSAANGVTYKVVAVNSTTLTLDRKYSGESQVISTVTWITRTTTAPTAAAGIGVEIIASEIGVEFDVVGLGILAPDRTSADGNRRYSGASLTLGDGAKLGAGTPALVRELEAQWFIERGNQAVNDGILNRPVSGVITPAAGGYDLYFLRNEYSQKGLDRKLDYNITFAFEDGNNVQQASFKALFDVINGLTATPVAKVATPNTGSAATGA